MQKLQDILQMVGLDKKEASIYLACLQFGNVTATTIARVTGIPRTSLYDIAPKLVEQGFLTISKKQKTTFFIATDPSKIIDTLHHRKEKIEHQIQEFKQNLSDFQSVKSFVGIVPSVQYYEWREALELFFQQIAQAEYSYSIFSLDDLLKHVFFDIDELLKHLSHPWVKGAQRIMTYSENAIKYKKMVEKINKKIKRKILPKWYTLAAEITLFEWTLLQMSFWDPKPAILEMKHPIYYQAHKTLFDYIWKSI